MATETIVCTHQKWLIDNRNIGTCANPECEEVRQFPLNKGDPVIVLKVSKCNSQVKEEEMKTGEPTNIKARHNFYEENKDAIVADFLKMGKQPARRKWRIPKGTLPRLIEKWLSPEQVAIMNQVGMPAAETNMSNNGQLPLLPPFPPFSALFDGPAQLKWLEIYEELLDRHSVENMRSL